MGCSAGVITTWYHHRVTVVDGHRFIQVSIIGKHPLEGKSLARVEAVIIDFLQGRFIWELIRIMLVGRVTRPATTRGDHLHNKQAVGGFGFWKDVANVAGVGAAATGFAAHAFRRDQPCRMVSGTRSLADCQFQIRQCRDAVLILIRQIKRVGRFILENINPLTESSPVFFD